ncbi:MAG TPA: hypothetical protein VG937_09270 [Polyangiaceae bacterium]|nr:hypothetical protein [Polyangiaceae bacterium]
MKQGDEISERSRSGEVITFYSYKGGVGRSMAVANVGALLAYSGNRVLLLDFDFEAPGLHRYFGQRNADGLDRAGVIELLTDAVARVRSPQAEEGLAQASDGESQGLPGFAEFESSLLAIRGIFRELFDTGNYAREVEVRNEPDGLTGRIVLASAGRFDPGYPGRVRSFPWESIHETHPDFFRAFALELASRYDYVLVDSRTGITDVGSVCTVLLPEKLVLVFVPNEQALHGAVEVGRQAVAQRSDSNDLRPLPLFPVLSRLENAEDALQLEWSTEACRRFELAFQDIYAIESIDLRYYFNAVQLPHRSFYAYGERLAVERESLERTNSLAFAYRRFVDFLTFESVHDAQLALRSGSAASGAGDSSGGARPEPVGPMSTTAARLGTGMWLSVGGVLIVLAGLVASLYRGKPRLDPLDTCLTLAAAISPAASSTDAQVASVRYRNNSSEFTSALADPTQRTALENCWQKSGLEAPRVAVKIAVQVKNQKAPGTKVILAGTGLECMTANDGVCTFSLFALPASAPAYEFRALEGFREATTTVSAKDLKGLVQLQLVSHILGIVVRQNDNPMPNATVVLEPSDYTGTFGRVNCLMEGEPRAPCSQATTDDKGEVSFELSRAVAKGLITVRVGQDEQSVQVDWTRNVMPNSFQVSWAAPTMANTGLQAELPPGTKVYVSVGSLKNSSGHTDAELDALVQPKLVAVLAKSKGYASAGDSTRSVVQVAQYPRLKAFYLSPKLLPIEYAEGSLRVKLEVAFFSYPAKSLLGNYSVLLTQPGVTGPSPADEAELIKLAAERAGEKFIAIARDL